MSPHHLYTSLPASYGPAGEPTAQPSMTIIGFPQSTPIGVSSFVSWFDFRLQVRDSDYPISIEVRIQHLGEIYSLFPPLRSFDVEANQRFTNEPSVKETERHEILASPTLSGTSSSDRYSAGRRKALSVFPLGGTI